MRLEPNDGNANALLLPVSARAVQPEGVVPKYTERTDHNQARPSRVSAAETEDMISKTGISDQALRRLKKPLYWRSSQELLCALKTAKPFQERASIKRLKKLTAPRRRAA